MPVPQLTPPGHLDQHSLVVALTPVLLCLVVALACWIITGRRSDGGALRVLAAVNLAAALMLQALFLLPWGPAAAYTEPLAGGLVRIGWIASGSAFALGCWALWRWHVWRWHPWQNGTSASRWCLRVALALALPVIAVPGLLVAVAADVPAASGRRCWLTGALALLVTGVILGVPTLPPTCVWLLHAVTMTAGVALVGRGPWAVPLIVATLVAWCSW